VKVFVKGKPHGNGIKMYLLADATCYTFDFWIYRGEQPPTHTIVTDFVDKLPGKHNTYVRL
jgi:hypothetical protein